MSQPVRMIWQCPVCQLTKSAIRWPTNETVKPIICSHSIANYHLAQRTPPLPWWHLPKLGQLAALNPGILQ